MIEVTTRSRTPYDVELLGADELCSASDGAYRQACGAFWAARDEAERAPGHAERARLDVAREAMVAASDELRKTRARRNAIALARQHFLDVERATFHNPDNPDSPLTLAQVHERAARKR